MRVLAVDVGNTSVALGVWEDGVLSRVAHIDDAAAAVEAAGEILREEDVRKIAYLSVVAREDARWEAFAKEAGVELHRITHQDFAKTGIVLDYPEVESIGADRLADAAAAAERYGTGLVVCDFGTAFTAAVITKDGRWTGGAIAPGFPLMRDYLFERCAALPKIDIARIGECPGIGKSTEEAMVFGLVAGYRGMVREIVETLQKNCGGGLRIVATGGFARRALEGAGIDCIFDETLTLHGAGLLASGEDK
ncbi:MAG: type III pantothenate kinase [Kiritimatiellae bacterium]|nr:type III pantothenate kinase [Kiritimatiellia bacterium]